METTTQRLMNRLSAFTLPGALALVWVATAITQRFQAPALGTEIAATALAVPLTIWAFSRHYVNQRQLSGLLPMSIPVFVMLASAMLSGDPRDALLGTPPLWQGWLLWAAMLGWLILVYVGSDWQDLIDSTRVLAVAGTIAAVWALAERFGLITPYDSLMGPAMALFDNPLSLGQGLMVTIACSGSLAVRRAPTPRWVRVCFLIATAVQVGAVLAIGSDGPLVALGFGAAAFGVTETGKSRGARALFISSTAVVIALVLAFGLLSAIWSGAFGPDAFNRADAALNNRLRIWTDAIERTAREPTLGTGPTQFDTVVDWSVVPTGGIDVWFTFAQHSILLTWLMEVGLLGFAMFGVAAVVIGVRLLRVARSSRSSEPIRVLAAGCVATFIAMLSTWPDPLALVCVTVIVGCLVSPYRSLRHEPRALPDKKRSLLTLLAPGAITLSALVFVLIALAPDIQAQYRLTRAHTSGDVMRAFSQALLKTEDPFYLEEELFAINALGEQVVSDDGAIEIIRRLDADYPPHAKHRVDIPLLALEIIWSRSADLEADELWALSYAFARRGSSADPDMGIWKYALARAAVTAERVDALAHIDAAMRAQVPPTAKAQLLDWRASATATGQ